MPWPHTGANCARWPGLLTHVLGSLLSTRKKVCVMSRGPYPFKESDIVRACNAAKKAGMTVSAVEIDKIGTLRIITLQPDAKPTEESNDVNFFDQEAERLRRQATGEAE
jgi:hypothetical protein